MFRFWNFILWINLFISPCAHYTYQNKKLHNLTRNSRYSTLKRCIVKLNDESIHSCQYKASNMFLNGYCQRKYKHFTLVFIVVYNFTTHYLLQHSRHWTIQINLFSNIKGNNNKILRYSIIYKLVSNNPVYMLQYKKHSCLSLWKTILAEFNCQFALSQHQVLLLFVISLETRIRKLSVKKNIPFNSKGPNKDNSS